MDRGIFAAMRRWRAAGWPRLRPRLDGWGRRGLDLLFPPRCGLCDADLGPRAGELLLCAACRATLDQPTPECCPRCGAIPIPTASGEAPPHRCRVRMHFDAVLPLGLYRGELREAVLRMKRPSGEALAVAMAGLYAERFAPRLAALQPTLVVPTPMYWLRRWLRKMNNPEIVAEILALRLGLPLRRALVQRRPTRQQKQLLPGQRPANVRGAFRPRTVEGLRGAAVLLVDDVLTTGATASEAAAALKRAGAKRVIVAVLGRAEGDGATP